MADVPRAANAVVVRGGVHGARPAAWCSSRESSSRRGRPAACPRWCAASDFGWSGHGFEPAPAIGDILAHVVMDGRAPGWDLTALRWSRFRDGALLPRASAADPPH